MDSIAAPHSRPNCPPHHIEGLLQCTFLPQRATYSGRGLLCKKGQVSSPSPFSPPTAAAPGPLPPSVSKFSFVSKGRQKAAMNSIASPHSRPNCPPHHIEGLLQCTFLPQRATYSGRGFLCKKGQASSPSPFPPPTTTAPGPLPHLSANFLLSLEDVKKRR